MALIKQDAETKEKNESTTIEAPSFPALPESPPVDQAAAAKVFGIIRGAHERLEEMFEDADGPERQAMKAVFGDVRLVQAEKAIDEQAGLAMSQETPKLQRVKAIMNVAQGMKYWMALFTVAARAAQSAGAA